MDCPKCNGKLGDTSIDVIEMSKNKDLKGADLEYEFTVDQCFICGGVWFDKGKLESYLRQGMDTLKSPSIDAAMDQKWNAKKGNCPVCSVEMLQKPYSLDHGVQVDVCPKCEGVWLDSTEIDRLEADEWKLRPAQSVFSSLINGLLNLRNKSDPDE